MLDDFGLVPTLQRHLQGFQETTGIAVDYAPGDVGPLPDDVELALFRIVQECMENVRKHSGSPTAHVHLERQNGQVTLCVEDAGRGFTQHQDRGSGLGGMRERVEAVGGVIRVDSAPGKGVRVEVSIPLKEQAWTTHAFASS
jgi:two-component system sensor histidine kinase DegS